MKFDIKSQYRKTNGSELHLFVICKMIDHSQNSKDCFIKYETTTFVMKMID